VWFSLSVFFLRTETKCPTRIPEPRTPDTPEGGSWAPSGHLGRGKRTQTQTHGWTPSVKPIWHCSVLLGANKGEVEGPPRGLRIGATCSEPTRASLKIPRHAQ
jgi:hypothetical protein